MPRLLDLFCKAGGASVGYHRAGFDVVGVDIEYQPGHPGAGLFPLEGFTFVQSEACNFLEQYGHEFDAIHASPPCQAFTGVKALGIARNGSYKEHLDLIGPIRELLEVTSRPWVIENVPGAPLRNPIVLCGTMFPPLQVYRHRLFETNWPLTAPKHLPHNDKTPSVGHGTSQKGFISVCGTGGVKGFTAQGIVKYWQSAMGIDWMNREELAQAIPPAYTAWIGKRLLCAIAEAEQKP
jgi:DNA (cytosine-5)-methyltransferase 1